MRVRWDKNRTLPGLKNLVNKNALKLKPSIPLPQGNSFSTRVRHWLHQNAIDEKIFKVTETRKVHQTWKVLNNYRWQ